MVENSNPHFQTIICNLPVNTGFAGALTVGYFMSSGEYIAVNDADDISHPLRLDKQVNFLLENPDYDLIGANYKVFYNADSIEDGQKSNWLQYGDSIQECYAVEVIVSVTERFYFAERFLT